MSFLFSLLHISPAFPLSYHTKLCLRVFEHVAILSFRCQNGLKPQIFFLIKYFLPELRTGTGCGKQGTQDTEFKETLSSLYNVVVCAHGWENNFRTCIRVKRKNSLSVARWIESRVYWDETLQVQQDGILTIRESQPQREWSLRWQRLQVSSMSSW